MLHIYFSLAGLIFATAGVFKLHLAMTDPFASFHTHMPLWLLVGAGVFEVALAFLNFFTRKSFVSVINFLFFSIAALISGFRWLADYSNCGCFGTFEIPPLAVFILDLCFLVVFAAPVMRSSLSEGLQQTSQILAKMSRLPAEQAGAVIGFFVALPALLLFLGPFSSGGDQDFVIGTSLDTAPSGKTLYYSDPPAELACRVELENRSNQTISIVGGGASCGCITLGDYKTDILPGKSRVFNVRVKVQKLGEFRHMVVYYLDNVRQYQVTVEIDGVLFEKESA